MTRKRLLLAFVAVAVTARARARGVGARLMQVAERYAASRGGRRLSLFTADSNLAALELFLRRGFRIVDRRRRFYARQFQSRAATHGRVLARLQRHLDEYLGSPRPREDGLPTVATCARSLGYSPDYLSDLLREETGESARDHIHGALIEAAKKRLAGSSDSVAEIAYGLGFQQPQHFSKLFKQKTGFSPGHWRG